MGDDLEFAFQVVNETGHPMALRIDYEIDYMKASGKLAPKRYKCSDKIYGPGIWKVERSSHLNRSPRVVSTPEITVFTLL